MQRWQKRLFCCARDLLLLLDLRWLSGVSAAAMAHVVLEIRLDKVAYELRAIKRGRRSVSRLEVSDEMTLVVQSDLVSDLLHTEKARLQQVFRFLHSQQSQVTDRRHADVGFENVAQAPN